MTTGEFLPQHRRQLAQTRALISQAEQHGHQRVAEMNRTVETNLIAIIGGLTGGRCVGTCSSSCACTSTSPTGPQQDDNAS